MSSKREFKIKTLTQLNLGSPSLEKWQSKRVRAFPLLANVRTIIIFQGFNSQASDDRSQTHHEFHISADVNTGV